MIVLTRASRNPVSGAGSVVGGTWHSCGLELLVDEVALSVVLLGLGGDELQRALDLSGDGGGDGQMGAGGTETELVGNPVDSVNDAVRAGVGVGALLGGDGALLGVDVLDGALLGRVDAVLGLVAAKGKVT